MRKSVCLAFANNSNKKTTKESAEQFGRLVTLENKIQWRSEIHLFEVNKIVEISCHEII